ncbi:transcriptional regulator [Haloplanus rallus]|uniref:HTH-type transcriptional regulator n=1 Tax=Haloplanus rallus TaxID=1816183 RepID=A0A6B9FDU0_9EURY|nr:MarR family transcriptional regulator [Haloplanus rallus]QGX94760.1 transcriptional regulator [Haloplanus rallus]
MSGDGSAAAREEVIESMERSAEVYGLSRSAGRVYGVLYFAAEPLSIPGLVEETGYAKSTISNVTRRLTRIGLIRRRSSGGGGRRVRFEPETDLWFVVRDVLQQHVAREMGSTRRTLDRSLSRVDDGDTATRAHIEDLATTYDEFETLLELAMDHSVEELIDAIEAYERD